ncbi:oxidoreductase [Phytohabitans suffuscus]|uniref:Oxidoreductase n=1 Tax=Phytohabitans suffuscus TaxID=624315 RepID=A0A6F8YJP3_9ACTN|nr:SDR family NAD(P)-dependent oxidoreductase [Phytohabitans suffuscus]BCB86354.1 oxidoreductase [Phytohabitans suffuscus]
MTDNNTLSGRVAVVTGATSGIGAATARRLVAAGASVALLGRREDRLKGLTTEIGPAAVPVAVDVADQEAVYAAAATARSALGRVDLVVANAGVMLAAPFESAQTVEWDQMIGTNLNGLLYTARAFVDDLLAAAADGRAADLVLVGSIGGHQVFPNYAVYTATKAAVAHLTRGCGWTSARAAYGSKTSSRASSAPNWEPGCSTPASARHSPGCGRP